MFFQEDIIYAFAETKKYFNENKDVNTNPEMIYNSIIKGNIMELGKEMKNVLYINVDQSQKRIRNVLQDQFRKLRNHFA